MTEAPRSPSESEHQPWPAAIQVLLDEADAYHKEQAAIQAIAVQIAERKAALERQEKTVDQAPPAVPQLPEAQSPEPLSPLEQLRSDWINIEQAVLQTKITEGEFAGQTVSQLIATSEFKQYLYRHLMKLLGNGQTIGVDAQQACLTLAAVSKLGVFNETELSRPREQAETDQFRQKLVDNLDNLLHWNNGTLWATDLELAGAVDTLQLLDEEQLGRARARIATKWRAVSTRLKEIVLEAEGSRGYPSLFSDATCLLAAALHFDLIEPQQFSAVRQLISLKFQQSLATLTQRLAAAAQGKNKMYDAEKDAKGVALILAAIARIAHDPHQLTTEPEPAPAAPAGQPPQAPAAPEPQPATAAPEGGERDAAEQRLRELYLQNFSYQDVRDLASDPLIRETFEKERQRVEQSGLTARQREYVALYAAFVDEFGESKVESVVEEIQADYRDLVRKIGIVDSVYGQSSTWARWDLIKQAWYAASHLKIKDSLYTYKPIDVMHEPNQDEIERIKREIVDRHLGWEVYNIISDSSQGAQDRLPAWLRTDELFWVIKNDLTPISDGHVPSFELSKAGQLVRERLAKHERAGTVQRASQPEPEPIEATAAEPAAPPPAAEPASVAAQPVASTEQSVPVSEPAAVATTGALERVIIPEESPENRVQRIKDVIEGIAHHIAYDAGYVAEAGDDNPTRLGLLRQAFGDKTITFTSLKELAQMLHEQGLRIDAPELDWEQHPAETYQLLLDLQKDFQIYPDDNAIERKIASIVDKAAQPVGSGPSSLRDRVRRLTLSKRLSRWRTPDEPTSGDEGATG